MAAANIRLQHQDSLSMSSVDLTPSPRFTPAHVGMMNNAMFSLPPVDHPLTPVSYGHLAHSPNQLQLPKLLVTKCGNAPSSERNGVSDADQSRRHSIQSVHHGPLSNLSKSLSSLSVNSAQSQACPLPNLDSDESRWSSNLSFSSSVGIRSVFEGLLHRGGTKQETHAKDDVLSRTRSPLEVSPVTSPVSIKKKLDSISGSMYSLGDPEGGGGDRKERRKISLRLWLRKMGSTCTCGVKWKCSCRYRIDPQGEYVVWGCAYVCLC